MNPYGSDHPDDPGSRDREESAGITGRGMEWLLAIALLLMCVWQSIVNQQLAECAETFKAENKILKRQNGEILDGQREGKFAKCPCCQGKNHAR